MTDILRWIGGRFAEPSSYAGLSGAIGSVSHMVTSGQTSSALIGTALAGLAAFFMPELGRR
jgi:hypothetical protein